MTSSFSFPSLSRRRRRRRGFRSSRRRPKLTFTDQEYSSGDGMITTVWGPPMWHFLHTMSFNYPVKPTATQQQKYREFIQNLEFVLPCGKCRANLHENFKKHPLTIEHMKSRETFSRYIYELHELVNTMLKKPSGLSYEEVRDTYEHFRSRCGGGSKNKQGGEKGCTEPVYVSKKPQCILNIVPRSCSLARSRRHVRVSSECLKQRYDHHSSSSSAAAAAAAAAEDEEGGR